MKRPDPSRTGAFVFDHPSSACAGEHQQRSVLIIIAVIIIIIVVAAVATGQLGQLFGRQQGEELIPGLFMAGADGVLQILADVSDLHLLLIRQAEGIGEAIECVAVSAESKAKPTVAISSRR